MDYTTLGKTGLRVSIMGLGGGGFSRLGHGTGQPPSTSIAIVHRALDLGVNFIDTAESYGTEPLIGQALQAGSVNRESVVLSTKKSLHNKDGSLIKASDLARGLEASLQRLKTDYVEIYHLHAVEEGDYHYALSEWVPALLRLRDEGKLRFVGVTEQFAADPGHAMLQRAVRDDVWDVMMVGFNMLNQSARTRLLSGARANNTGILCMFAVRNAFSRPERLREIALELDRSGQLEGGTEALEELIAHIDSGDDAKSLTDAAYRFCRAEPGIHVVLSGTGNLQHLEENANSLLSPPLPAELHGRIQNLFGKVDTVSGQ